MLLQKPYSCLYAYNSIYMQTRTYKSYSQEITHHLSSISLVLSTRKERITGGRGLEKRGRVQTKTSKAKKLKPVNNTE